MKKIQKRISIGLQMNYEKYKTLKQWFFFLTLVIEILQISADVDTDVFHFHVLETGKLVHVLQQTIILTDAWKRVKWSTRTEKKLTINAY